MQEAGCGDQTHVPGFGRMCASLVLSEGGESPARDAGSTAQLGDDPLCWKKADLSPEVRVAEEPGKHGAQGRIQIWQEGQGRAGEPRERAGSWERAWGRMSSTAEASGFTRRRTLQVEGGSPGGTEPMLWTCVRRRVSVTWSPAEAGSRSRGQPSSRSSSGATSLSELLLGSWWLPRGSW